MQLKIRDEGYFNVRPNEIRIVLVMGVIIFAHSLALQVANIVSISGFISEVSVPNILPIWIIEMLLIIGATAAQSLIVDRFKRLKLLRWMCLLFAGLYIGLAVMFAVGLPGSLNYTLLMLFVDQQMYFFPAIFWILASDMIGMSQAKRLFPIIATFGIVGEIAGLGISAAAPRVLSQFGLQSSVLIYLVILLYLLPFGLSLLLSKERFRQTVQQTANVRESLSEGWNFIKDVASFRYLILSMFVVAIVVTIIEFHFLASTEQVYSNMDDFQTFYSLIFLAQTLVAIALQALVTGRLINNFGLKNTFVIMPAFAILCIGWALGAPGIVSAAGAYLVVKLALNSIDDIARKTLQSLVPEERRGRVSMFMDSYVFAGGVIVSALVIGLVLIVQQFIPTIPASTFYLSIGGILAIIALWWILKMRTVYESSLFNWRLKRRQHSASVIDKLGI